MRRWLKRWTLLPAYAVSLLTLALMLTGCASRSSVACEEPKPLPTALTEPISQDARSFSGKVQSYFTKVESWLSEAPQKQTR